MRAYHAYCCVGSGRGSGTRVRVRDGGRGYSQVHYYSLLLLCVCLLVRWLYTLWWNVSIDELLIIFCGSLFHSLMVFGKKECLYVSVFVWDVWYLYVWELRVLRVLASWRYSCLLMSMWLWDILYMIVSLCACLRLSNGAMFICCFIRVVIPGSRE